MATYKISSYGDYFKLEETGTGDFSTYLPKKTTIIQKNNAHSIFLKNGEYIKYLKKDEITVDLGAGDEVTGTADGLQVVIDNLQVLGASSDTSDIDIKNAQLVYDVATHHNIGSDKFIDLEEVTTNGTTTLEIDSGGAPEVDITATLATAVATNYASRTRQSKEYIHIPYGNTVVGMITAELLTTAATTNDTNVKVGMFDNDDGVYVQLADTDTDVSFVLKKSGTTVTTARSACNIDKMDGTGPSQIDLGEIGVDPGLQAAMYTWVFVIGNNDGSKISVGLYLKNRIYLMHEFTDNDTDGYNFNTALPVRLEINETYNDAADSEVTMSHRNIAVYAVNKYHYIPKTLSKLVTKTQQITLDSNDVGSEVTNIVCALRLKTAYHQAKIRVHKIHLMDIDETNPNAMCEWQLIKNITTIKTFPPTFNNWSTMGEYCDFTYNDETDQAKFDPLNDVVGGEVLASGYFSGPTTTEIELHNVDLLLNNAVNGSVTDVAYLVVTCHNGTTKILGGLTWEEFL
jgi:hypothetical protein